MEESSSLALENMSQPVKKSEVGVPQRSVLGPLLNLIHIDELQNSTSLKVLNFTDDTMLYKTFTKDTYLNVSRKSNTERKRYQVGLWKTMLN